MIDEAKVEDLIVELSHSLADSDRIRRYLLREGIVLTEGPLGTTWRRSES